MRAVYKHPRRTNIESVFQTAGTKPRFSSLFRSTYLYFIKQVLRLNYWEVSVCPSETHQSDVFNVCHTPEKTPGAHLDVQIRVNTSKKAGNSFGVRNYDAASSNFPQFVATAYDRSSSVLFWIRFDPWETVGHRRRQLELIICIQLHTQQQQKGALRPLRAENTKALISSSMRARWRVHVYVF